MRQKIMLTSGFNFEGYEITEYVGFMSSESVLGTGFLSELGAGFADFAGARSNMFSNKLEEAKDQALAGLIEKAKAAEANAIIGVDIDYNMFSGNLIGVIANGTIVKIRKIQQKAVATVEIPCHIMNYNLSASIRPYRLLLGISDSGHIFLNFQLVNYLNKSISAIHANVRLISAFQDEIDLGDLYFSSVSALSNSEMETEKVMIPPLSVPASLIQSAYVDVKRWIADEEVMAAEGENRMVEKTAEELLDLKGKFGNDAVTEFSVSDGTWTCFCGNVNPVSVNVCPLCHRGSKDVTSTDMGQFLDLSTLLQTLYVQCEPLKSTREIYERARQFNEEHHGCIPQDILNTLSRKADTERMFGNSKSGTIKYLQSEIQKAKQ